jgi:hypothetical protein
MILTLAFHTRQGGEEWRMGLENKGRSPAKSLPFHQIGIAQRGFSGCDVFMASSVCIEPHVNALGPCWTELQLLKMEFSLSSHG